MRLSAWIFSSLRSVATHARQMWAHFCLALLALLLTYLQKDYTNGQLEELIDVIIQGGASLFVCAVGVPPKWVVEKLHAAGIPIMKHVGRYSSA